VALQHGILTACFVRLACALWRGLAGFAVFAVRDLSVRLISQIIAAGPMLYSWQQDYAL